MGKGRTRYRNLNPYRDSFAPDGIIACGWRYVKKDGRVKIGGFYFKDAKLNTIIGEYVHVQFNDYWQTEVSIFRGVLGCMSFYCDAKMD